MSNFKEVGELSIWGNDRKTTDNHPDFTGTLEMDGKKYQVSAWKRRPDANPKAPALKGKISVVEEGQSAAPVVQSVPQVVQETNDAIPF